MDSPVKVLVVDDNACMVWALRRLVDSQAPAMTVVDAVSKRCDVLRSVRQHQPDVVLLEITLEGQSGIDLITLVNEACSSKIIIFTGVRDPAVHDRAILSGAHGLVLKSEPVDVVLRAIKAVHAGELWLKRNVTAKIVGIMAAAYHHSLSPVSNSVFTPSEIRVISAAVKYRGAPNKVVANLLHMSPNTFRNHLSTIYAKLGIHRRLDLVLYGIQHRLGERAGFQADTGDPETMHFVPVPTDALGLQLEGSAAPSGPIHAASHDLQDAPPRGRPPLALDAVQGVREEQGPGRAIGRFDALLLKGTQTPAPARVAHAGRGRLIKASARPPSTARATRR